LVPFPGTANYEKLPEELRENWDRIRYYHNGQYPISLCDLNPEELYLIEKQARYEFYGRLRYFFANPLAFRFPLKLSMVKAGASIAYGGIKLLLFLSGRRVVSRLKKRAIGSATE
jgi:hypothetical protein